MTAFRNLIIEAQEGDIAAKRLLVAEFAGLIEKECKRFGLQQYPDLTHSDMAQEVKIQMIEKIEQFKGGDAERPRAVFESWLRKTCSRVVQNILRKKGNTFNSPAGNLKDLNLSQQNLVDIGLATPSSVMARQENYERARHIISEVLDDECKLILRLKIVEGLTFNEIGNRLKLSIDQTRYRFEKSLEKLKSFFNL